MLERPLCRRTGAGAPRAERHTTLRTTWLRLLVWGRTSLGVRCLEGANWVVYVPVQIRLWMDAWVAAKGTDRTTVLSIATDAFTWMPGDADWDVGVPEVTSRESVRNARKQQEEIRAKQRVGV